MRKFLLSYFLTSTVTLMLNASCCAVKIKSQEEYVDFLGTGQTIQLIRRDDDYKVFAAANDFGLIFDNGFGAIQPDFFDYVHSLEDVNVLEIGAGNGHTLRDLLASHPQNKLRYVLNEIDPHSQKYLRQNFSETGVLSKAPALQHLQKNQQPYDAIYSSMVFQWFDPVQYVETLLECHRNLKESGKFFLIQSSCMCSKEDPGMIDFQKNKTDQVYFPGYYTSPRAVGMNWFDSHQTLTRGLGLDVIAQTMLSPKKYPLFNLHDQESLSLLVSACGFEVEKSYNYYEKYENRSVLDYVGIVARKSTLPLNQDKILAIKTQAQELKERAAECYVAPYYTIEDAINFNKFRLPFYSALGAFPW